MPAEDDVAILERDFPSLPLEHVVQNSVRDRHGHIIAAAAAPEQVQAYVQRVLEETDYKYDH